MAEEDNIDEQLDENQEGEPKEAPKEKMISESKLQEIIKGRLKNHVAKQEELESKLATMQGQLAQKNQPEVPQEQPPENPPVDNNAAPPSAPEAGLTKDDLQEAMNQQNIQQAQGKYEQSIAEMTQNDPEFKTLVEKNDGLKIPHEVAMHITNSFDKDTAQKTLKRLLTSTLDNANMRANAYQGMATGEWGEYQKWLQGLMKPNEATPPTDNSPDLSSLDKSDADNTSSAAQSAVDDFVKNSY